MRSFLRYPALGMGAATAASLLIMPSGVTLAHAAPPVARTTAPLVALPAAPVLPAKPAFADEVQGRRLLYAARAAYRTAPTVRFSAVWREVVGNTGENARPATPVANGSETLDVALERRRLSLKTETIRPGGTKQTIHRAIADGASLITTRFEQKDAAAKPLREFARLPLDGEIEGLGDALAIMKFASATTASRMLFAPDWSIRGHAWRVPGTTGTVLEVEPLVESGRGDNRTTRQRVRRYKLDPKSSLLLSFEEWAVTTSLAPPKKDKRGNLVKPLGPRVAYRIEEYGTPQAGDIALPASLFAAAQAGPPPSYTEVAPPGGEGDLPAAEPVPASGDARAIALLRRWEWAQGALLTYTARVQLTAEMRNKTEDARPIVGGENRSAVYSVSLRRPGQVAIQIQPDGGAERTPQQQRRNDWLRAQVAASDGTHVTVYDAPNQADGRTVLLGDNPEALATRLQQAGYRDGAETFTWLLQRPSALFRNADRAVYKGKQTLPTGEAVEVVEITETAGGLGDEGMGRRRRWRAAATPATRTTVTTVYLGADNLPRRIERYRTVDIAGRFDRDEPPNQLLVAQYASTVVNAEIGPETFALARPVSSLQR